MKWREEDRVERGEQRIEEEMYCSIMKIHMYLGVQIIFGSKLKCLVELLLGQ